MKTILFVDDEQDVLDGIRRTLRSRRRDWQMLFCTGPEAALAKLEAGPVDVIVSDMKMPFMDGAKLLTRVRELHPSAVRIVLSGEPGFDAALSTVPVAHRFLSKPCDPETLTHVIEGVCSLQSLQQDSRIKRLVGDVSCLPAVPRILSRLHDALNDPEIPLSTVASIISQDISLSAKVLQLVNSAFFGLPTTMTKIVDAVSYLGLKTVGGIVTSIAAFGQFQRACRCPGISIEAEQAHALQVASIARSIAPSRAEGEDAFTAGMLHDIGKLLLATQLADQYQEVLATARKEQRALVDVEAEMLGITHSEVGAYLLGLWGLPAPVVETVAARHNPELTTDQVGVVALLHAAHVLVREADSGGAEVPIDLDLLERAGYAGRVDEWRARTSDLVGAQGA